MSRTLALLAIVLTAVPAAAQNVDIVAQDISVDVSTPTPLIHLDIHLEATGPASSLAMTRFVMPVVMAEVDGVAATVEPHPSYPAQALLLTYPAPLEPGARATVSLDLSGTANCGGANAYCFTQPDLTVFTAPAPGVAWYHTNLFASNPFVGSIEVLVPSGQTVVTSPTTQMAVESLGAVDRWSFQIAAPAELLGLYAGRPDVVQSANVSVLYDDTKHDQGAVDAALEVSAGVLPILSSQYGPLPVDEAFVVTVPKSFGGGAMGMLGTVFVNEVVFTSHTYLVEQGMAHEFAHSWWGNLATADDPNEAPFFSEGFAEYAGWRALGELRGESIRDGGMRMNAVWYMYRRPGDDVAIVAPLVWQHAAFIWAVYHKGPLVLRALEELVGAGPFDAALKAFQARGIGGLGVAALAEDVAQASGRDVTTFLDQWLRQTGFPRLFVTPSANGEAVSLSIDLPENFTLALPLRFTFSNGTTAEHRLVLAPGVSEHTFEVSERPIAIEIDPAWTHVREVIPARAGDVTLDGEIDGADLIAVALSTGTFLPQERRIDGGYDPLFDVDGSGLVDAADLDLVHQAANAP